LHLLFVRGFWSTGSSQDQRLSPRQMTIWSSMSTTACPIRFSSHGMVGSISTNCCILLTNSTGDSGRYG
jgi:hypothetical protein